MNYTGPKPPYDHLNVEDKYSWVKTPRWMGKPMEVGPLSRMLVAYASGRDEFKYMVEMVLGKLDVPATALFSTLGRTAARAMETVDRSCAQASEIAESVVNAVLSCQRMEQ